MPMLKVLSNVRPRILVIAAAVTNAARQLNLSADMVITSGNDGQHMVTSKHYSWEALDFRTKHLCEGDRVALIRVVQEHLGANYQLLMEDLGAPNEHLHIEYDPKKGKSDLRKA